MSYQLEHAECLTNYGGTMLESVHHYGGQCSDWEILKGQGNWWSMESYQNVSGMMGLEKVFPLIYALKPGQESAQG